MLYRSRLKNPQINCFNEVDGVLRIQNEVIIVNSTGSVNKENTTMHRLFFISILLFVTDFANQAYPQIEHRPTTDETETIVDSNQDEIVRTTLEVFPKEIYFGDTLYFVAHAENLSNETLRAFYHSLKSDNSSVTIISPSTSKRYLWTPEYITKESKGAALRTKNLLPGEKRFSANGCYEFPPLDDWNDPFWKEFLKTIPPEGIVCQLQFNFWFCFRDSLFSSVRCERTEIQEILIKPRPENEMVLLEKWHKSTPEKFFPKVDGNRKVPYGMDLKSSGKSDIKIGGEKYDSWLFIRLGNRKPSDPNNPTTLDGWRKLEASLTPSTMRDEIRLTRLQLEYYSAQKGEASEKAKAELIDWLKSLPEVQRTIMTTFLVSKMYDFYYNCTSLRDQNRELMRSLYDTLDYGCQEAVCNFESINYSDRTLPPPKGVKVVRLFMEVVEPTAEDLAVGSKELPDGFRIWDAVGDTGATKMVAKFVELKEEEDTLVLENREKLHFNLMFSALSDEDKQHAREMSTNKSKDQTNQ